MSLIALVGAVGSVAEGMAAVIAAGGFAAVSLGSALVAGAAVGGAA